MKKKRSGSRAELQRAR